MGRPPCCDKSNVKRGLWTAEEDAKILAYVSNHGIGNWTLVPKKAGLNRCGKSCRLRWTNYLRPDLKRNSFTPDEEELIIDLHQAIGSRWSLIAKQLPGRTDNDVKNYWNTKLRKKLTKMGIDPVTHKPISQILSDFGNISGLPNTRSQKGSLNKHSNNTPMPISEPSSLVPAEGLLSTSIVKKPMLGQFQEILFTNCHSWDFQAQLQVINQESIQPLMFSEVASSSSPSSSSSTVNQFSSPQSFPCQSIPIQAAPTCPLSWSEFLLRDPFLSSDLQQQQEGDFQGIAYSMNSLMQNEMPQCKFTGESENNVNAVGHLGTQNDGGMTRGESAGGAFEVSSFSGGLTAGESTSLFEATSSSVKSFVDTILDRDSKIRSMLPELLDEYFDY